MPWGGGIPGQIEEDMSNHGVIKDGTTIKVGEEIWWFSRPIKLITLNILH